MTGIGGFADSRICVTGAAGFLGGHVVTQLREAGATAIAMPELPEHDLLEPSTCHEIVEGIDLVVHLAADVGGVGYLSDHPGRTLYANLLMNTQLMEAARLAGVGKFLSIGSTCAYPRDAALPLREDGIWQGLPAEDHAAYGVAKRVMLFQGQCYRRQYGFNAVHLLPVNLYGPGGNFDPASSTVVHALVRRFVEAARAGTEAVTVWGTGSTTRDLLYVEDAARAVVLAARTCDEPEPINLASGVETTIQGLVEIVAEATGYEGRVTWDSSRPGGARRVVVDCTRAREVLGFVATTDLREGIRRTVEHYVQTGFARETT